MSGKKLIKANIKFNEVSNKFDKNKQMNQNGSNSIHNSPNKVVITNSPYKLRLSNNSNFIYVIIEVYYLFVYV